MYQENDIKHASDERLYYLSLPHLITGSLETFEKEVPYLQDGKIIKKKIHYNQTFAKQIDELLMNSLDENKRTHGDYANNIKISIQSDKVVVSDNGRGLPIDTYVMASTQFRTSSNYNFLDGQDKTKDRETVGAHGIGAKIVPLFSEEYKLTTITLNKERGVLVCKNNMENIDSIEDVAPKSLEDKHGVTVEFKPDFKRLHMENISQDMINHIGALIVNIAFNNSNVNIVFQGKTIKVDSFSKFLKYYNDFPTILHQDEKMHLAVYPADSYEYVHLANGLTLNKGGVALTYISNSIISEFTERLKKGYSKITTNSVKNRLGVVLVFNNAKNLKFGAGQTKEEIKNTVTDLELNPLSYKNFAEKIFKNQNIKGPIIEFFKIQDEMEKRKAKGSLKAEKKEVFNKKHEKPTSKNWDYLMLAEGDSALNALPAAFGRENVGYLPLTGKPLNALKATPSKLKANARVMDIINQFGLGKDITNYKNLIIASDADLDGIHITSLVIALIYSIHPQLLKDQKVFILRTPVMMSVDKTSKAVDWVYSLDDVKSLKSGSETLYLKGLGDLSPQNLKAVFKKDGWDKLIQPLEWDQDSEQAILNWMQDSTIDFRKVALQHKAFDISQI